MAILTKQVAVEAVLKCDEIVRAWERWPPPEDQKMLYGDTKFKILGDEVVSALYDCCEAFFTTDIEPGAWLIAMQADKVRSELRRWIQERKMDSLRQDGQSTTNPRGTDEMWAAYNAMVLEAKRPQKEPPPSAKVQRESGANERAIAMALGWKNQYGEWDLTKVRKELRCKPEDEEYDPDNWVHPRELEKAKLIEPEWKARCEQVREELSILKAPRRERVPDKTPTEDLARLPGMTVGQIAKMKMVPETAIRSELAHLGLVLDGTGLHENQPKKKGPAEENDRLKQFDPHDELGEDIGQRILAMSEDGVKPRNIAKRLTQRLAMTITHQKVVHVLNGGKFDEEESEDSESEVPSVAQVG